MGKTDDIPELLVRKLARLGVARVDAGLAGWKVVFAPDTEGGYVSVEELFSGVERMLVSQKFLAAEAAGTPKIRAALTERLKECGDRIGFHVAGAMSRRCPPEPRLCAQPAGPSGTHVTHAVACHFLLLVISRAVEKKHGSVG